jgi:pyridoxal phosphate enzyme (YggS family)
MHEPAADNLATRWAAIGERVAASCAEAGRPLDAVRILPVSKTFGPELVREAVALGLHRFGENKAQEIRAKSGPLADCGIDWVMIGHLQTNKAKEIAELASEVQSLDRLELAHALDRRLEQAGRTIDILVQVKTSPEPSKYGLPPEQLPVFLRELEACPTLRVRGLMTMAIASSDAEQVRACFRSLRQCRDRARAEGYDLPRLSMGMSGDFPLAIQEGSTEVRIGTAIFGYRTYP